jgi:hypothetical protein
VFGFFKRLQSRASREADAPETTPPRAVPTEDERPGKSWFASSLDLHDGLEVHDADGDSTLPTPLADR